MLLNFDWEIDLCEIDMDFSEFVGKGLFGEIWKVFWWGIFVVVKIIRFFFFND